MLAGNDHSAVLLHCDRVDREGGRPFLAQGGIDRSREVVDPDASLLPVWPVLDRVELAVTDEHVFRERLGLDLPDLLWGLIDYLAVSPDPSGRRVGSSRGPRSARRDASVDVVELVDRKGANNVPGIGNRQGELPDELPVSAVLDDPGVSIEGVDVPLPVGLDVEYGGLGWRER